MTTIDITSPRPATHGWLEHFPVSFFAVAMGMFGLSLALHAAGEAPGMHRASLLMLATSSAVFAGIILTYIVKALRYPAAIAGEWAHPVRIAFFPAASVATLLLATAILPHMRGLALLLWIAGVALQGMLTLAVIGSWISHRSFQPAHLTPAWFIPAVGNVIVPVAGAQLGFIETSWLFFSAGLLFWIVLLTLVMNRLIFHDPIPQRLIPTLVILIAPPAVAFIAWYRLSGDMDAFARILLNSAYVFLAIVLTQARLFARLPFALSWWALSFPVAALTIASFLFAGQTGSPAHLVLAWILLAALALIVAGLTARTILGMVRGEICRPE